MADLFPDTVRAGRLLTVNEERIEMTAPLTDHILAHYLAHSGADLNTTDRAYPHGELLIIIEDRMQYGTRALSIKGSLTFKEPARVFVDLVIARGGFSTIKGAFGGSMHRLQATEYRAIVAEWRKTNPIVAESAWVGPGFWRDAFTRLSA